MGQIPMTKDLQFKWDDFEDIEKIKNRLQFTLDYYIRAEKRLSSNPQPHNTYISIYFSKEKTEDYKKYTDYAELAKDIIKIMRTYIQSVIVMVVTEICESKISNEAVKDHYLNKIYETITQTPLEEIKKTYFESNSLFTFGRECWDTYVILRDTLADKLYSVYKVEQYNIRYETPSLKKAVEKLKEVKLTEANRVFVEKQKPLISAIIDISKLGFATPPDLFHYEKCSIEELKMILKTAREKQQEYLQHVFRVGKSLQNVQPPAQEEEGASLS